MTQEQKAKAYDKALEIARQIHNGNPSSGTAIVVCEQIFPQLRESEDERIRKWIYEFVKRAREHAPEDCEDNPMADAALAWLEKQKGLMPPVNVDPCDASWDAYYQRGLNKGYELGLDAGRKEQKPELVQQPPITYTYNSNSSRDERLKAALLALLRSDLIKVKEGGYFTKQDLIEWVEQKPSWSEEDDKMLTGIIERGSSQVPFGDPALRGVQMEWLMNRLKSLRPQPREGIYQSAKRDLAIKFMNYLDENRPEGKMSLSNGECEDIDKAFKENDWAKIMRYVEKYSPSWKPSDEQLNALNFAITYFMHETNYKNPTELRDLYDDLLKLK